MPHRAAEFVERCSICKDPAPHGCLRCGRPLCRPHRPARGKRCQACEEDFELALERLPEPAALAPKERAIEQIRTSFSIGLFGLVTGVLVGVAESLSAGLKMGIAGFTAMTIISFLLLSLGWGVELGKLAQNRIAKQLRRRARRRFLKERKPGELEAPKEPSDA